MKTRTRNRIAAVLLTIGVSLPAHASPTCIAPEPACVLVLLGAVVTTIAHERDEHEAVDQQARRKHVPLKVGVNQVTHPDRHPGITTTRGPTRTRGVVREAW